MKTATKALATKAMQSSAIVPRVVLNVDCKLRVSRRGTLWTGEVLIETPMGPLRFAASADERLILAFLAKRAAAQGGVETSGLFDSLKKAAKGLAKKLSITKALESAKKVIKDPISAMALKLPTLPGPLGIVQRKAFGAAGNLIRRALGGDKRATALLGALKKAAMGGAPGPMKAWNTVKRLYTLVKTKSPTNILRGLGQEAYSNIAPQANLLRQVESQASRLPGPLGTAARTALNLVPGVPALRAAQMAHEAYQSILRGQVPMPAAMQALQQYAPYLSRAAAPLASAASGYQATWSPEQAAYDTFQPYTPSGPAMQFWPTAYDPYPYLANQRGYPYA